MTQRVGRRPEMNNPAESVLSLRNFCSGKIPRPELGRRKTKGRKVCKDLHVCSATPRSVTTVSAVCLPGADDRAGPDFPGGPALGDRLVLAPINKSYVPHKNKQSSEAKKWYSRPPHGPTRGLRRT